MSVNTSVSMEMMARSATRTMWSGTSDDVGELEESAYTVGPPTDDPEHLEQFDGNLEGAEAYESQVCASASRSFQEARELLSRVKSARSYFPVVGIDIVGGLAQPSTDRKVSRHKQEGQEETKDFSVKRWKVSRPWYTWSLAETPTSHSDMVHRCPRSVRQKLAQLEVYHITLLGFVVISACCLAKMDIAHQNAQ